MPRRRRSPPVSRNGRRPSTPPSTPRSRRASPPASTRRSSSSWTTSSRVRCWPQTVSSHRYTRHLYYTVVGDRLLCLRLYLGATILTIHLATRTTEAALAFYKALKVYPTPRDLVDIYNKTVDKVRNREGDEYYPYLAYDLPLTLVSFLSPLPSASNRCDGRDDRVRQGPQDRRPHAPRLQPCRHAPARPGLKVKCLCM